MFNFILTEKCDWDCSYCVFPNIKKPSHTNIDILKKHLPYIKKLQNQVKFNVAIQGGEIGFVNIKILEEFFKIWNEPIEVSTNGEFIRKGFNYNKILRPNIKQILLHITNDINKDIIIDYDINDPDIYINIGVCDSTLKPKKFANFLRKNEQYIFNFIDFEHDINKPVLIDNYVYKEFYERIKNISNVTNSAKQRIKNKLNNNSIKFFQKSCSSFNNTFTIDLINERIIKCARNYNHSWIELNKENLIKTINEYNVFSNIGLCNNCFRICQDQTITEKIKFRRKYNVWR